MRRRLYRRLAVVLVVLVGLYLVVDIVALQYLESRGASELAKGMAAERVSVDLGGLPFLPGLVRGRLRRAEVTVTGATGSGGLRVQTVQARLLDVRFDTGELVALTRSRFSGRTTLRGVEAFGRVEIVEKDLEEYLKRKVPTLQAVKVTSSAVELLFLAPEGAEDLPAGVELPTIGARLLPVVEGRRIVLRLAGVSGLPNELIAKARLATGAIELPPIPAGLSTDLHLGTGVLVVEAAGPEVEIQLGQGGIQP
jgi:hypothetical protein